MIEISIRPSEIADAVIYSFFYCENYRIAYLRLVLAAERFSGG